jgi:hypothetical protein
LTAPGFVTTPTRKYAARTRTDRTLIVAVCDPLVGLLAHELAAQHRIRVLPLLRTSGEALDPARPAPRDWWPERARAAQLT